MKPNTYCMLLHLSQLLVFCLPGFGIAIPILLWAIKKDQEQLVDQHGKIVINWLLTELIYFVAAAMLSFVIIGLLILPAVIIVGIVFPIIGGLKANDGIEWKYPLSISFFK
ncbi:MAG: DUF4870 domain-containing protein [Planctomycetaceae bacterium]|nr:DUF4870 domain-containing protein [Planctomycetaceae bacterium]